MLLGKIIKSAKIQHRKLSVYPEYEEKRPTNLLYVTLNQHCADDF